MIEEMSKNLLTCNANKDFYKAISALNSHTNPFEFIDDLSIWVSKQDKQMFQNLEIKNAKLIFFSISDIQKDNFLNVDTNIFSSSGAGYMLKDFISCKNIQNNCIDILKNFIYDKAFYMAQALGVDNAATVLVAREGGDELASNDYFFHRDAHSLDNIDKIACQSRTGKSNYEYNLSFNLIGSNGTIFYKPATNNLTSVPIPDKQEVSNDALFTANTHQGAVWLRGKCNGSGAIHSAPDVQDQRLALILLPYDREEGEYENVRNYFERHFNNPDVCPLSSELEFVGQCPDLDWIKEN